ncbi:Planctomycete cytochrome C [Rubripirellula lacrimiformis]|uniref:Planctomycete cytochrome C n=1 Tax=Rubripirellula lacrimiformis TaxID=1930273 RepID=A0A517NE79_9BACT|nr:DUF1553 domain-containing protein [Rubripirellula lacrimiformis]QDT05434.1 Planctomycete cytochrome C [Rubripirellula lacrimiformis]
MPARTFLVSLLIACAVPSLADESSTITYNEDIRPILAENCFACHGTDSATREAGLRLDQRESAVDSGAITPGEADQSSIIQRIHLDRDDDELMPPADSHKKLTAEQKQTLTRWINEGAQYQPHWSFIPPGMPSLPDTDETSWTQNPIDRFVISRMKDAGFSPAPEADRRTLARRAALDITGLPPSPQQLQSFLDDQEPGAYQRYLDELFQSPAWGEQRGRYWLDYARYADTHGIHFDNYREIWAYRDWVIDAFNQNMPFDQFSIEQLAGDLLPEPTLDQQIATGFHRCNMTTNEGGIIDEEYAVLYARDRTDTTAAVWMGLTAGCAVCHDHKFDPISAKEFYSLSAFFNNTTQNVRDGNVANTPPILTVPIRADRDRFNELQQQIPETEAAIAAMVATAKTTIHESHPSPAAIGRTFPAADQLAFHAPLSEGIGNTTTVLIDGQLVPITAQGDLKWSAGLTGLHAIEAVAGVNLPVESVGDYDTHDAFTAAAWVMPNQDGVVGAIMGKLDGQNGLQGWDLWLNGGRPAVHFIHRWPEFAIKVIAGDKLPVGQWSHLAVTSDGSGTADGLRLFVNGIEQGKREVTNDTLETKTIRSAVALTIGSRDNNSVALGVAINDARLYDATLRPEELRDIADGSAAMLAASVPHAIRSESQTDALVRWTLDHNSGPYQAANEQLVALKSEQASILERATIAHVMHEKSTPPIAHILTRGEYDQRAEQVSADVPAVLPDMGDLPRNRLGLAKWLFRDDHPLTARVTVNRFWQEVFGTGLVRTSADFGVMGEMPSHPELLDYLAIEFRNSGWDVQALFRMILTSATYRQSAVHSQLAIDTDPQNRLLSHGPRFRMHAEMVRDSALWASGLLSDTIGGPSVRPYQPDGVWEAVAMPESNTRVYRRDEGESLYRRSMYTFWKRSAPPASMEILGAPNRESCTIQREQTNTPLQALVTLNDPQFVEAARGLATFILADPTAKDADRLQVAAQRLMSRPLTDQEIAILLTSLGRLRSFYESNDSDAAKLLTTGQLPIDETIPTAELAAWTMLCNELMNLDEVLCK